MDWAHLYVRKKKIVWVRIRDVRDQKTRVFGLLVALQLVVELRVTCFLFDVYVYYMKLISQPSKRADGLKGRI